jgi:hypothetical protein
MAETVDRFPDRLKSTSNFLEDAGKPKEAAQRSHRRRDAENVDAGAREAAGVDADRSCEARLSRHHRRGGR